MLLRIGPRTGELKKAFAHGHLRPWPLQLELDTRWFPMPSRAGETGKLLFRVACAVRAWSLWIHVCDPLQLRLIRQAGVRKGGGIRHQPKWPCPCHQRGSRPTDMGNRWRQPSIDVQTSDQGERLLSGTGDVRLVNSMGHETVVNGQKWTRETAVSPNQKQQ